MTKDCFLFLALVCTCLLALLVLIPSLLNDFWSKKALAGLFLPLLLKERKKERWPYNLNGGEGVGAKEHGEAGGKNLHTVVDSFGSDCYWRFP